MSLPIRQKSQIIDDDSDFRIEELENLAKQTHRLHQKQYQIVSIIGSQSSGKSTLLNSLFGTDFEVLNRQQRVGQTTKGIWFSVDSPSNIIILDVEGSDSREREDRTKIERQNSLFAFAISHTLMINIWTHQVGTWKGAQLQILQIILELNLKLFGSEKPKQIVFVVRDFVERRENPEACKQKLVQRVRKAWQQIPKPVDKVNVKLQDVFQLNVFFLPSKLQERQKQAWDKGISTVKKFLEESTRNKQLVHDNIPVTDLPRYMENIWTTIKSDKDINLPQEKVLLSSMRCQQIKKKVLETYSEDLRDEMEKSERSINLDFKKNVELIISRMLGDYTNETSGYIQEEAERIQDEMIKEIEDKIEESFHKQANMLADDCLKEFSDGVNRVFSKEKKMEEVNEEKKRVLAKFDNQLGRICYRADWQAARADKFRVELQKKYSQLVTKIIGDSIKEFLRILKKQTENSVSNAFYNREVFTTKFWPALAQELKKTSFKSRNSIQSLFTNLGQADKKQQQERYIREAEEHANEELRSYVKLKCGELKHFIMKHFEAEFGNEGDVPRQWPSLSDEQIQKLYDQLKAKYLKLVQDFRIFGIDKPVKDNKGGQGFRVSAIVTSMAEMDDELLSTKEEVALVRKLDEEMSKVLQEAFRKQKETYSASIPTWAYVVLGIAALDDIYLWFKSPMLAIPLTIIILIVVLAFVFGGKTLLNKVFGAAKEAAEGAVSNITRNAASNLIGRRNQ